MNNLATYIRIFNATPDDDLVKKRTAAVKEIATRFSKSRGVLDIFKTADQIAAAVSSQKTISPALSKEIEAAVQKTSKAFISDADNELEVSVYALVGALQSFSVATFSAGKLFADDVLAIGLWSALGFQASGPDAKLEVVRLELLDVARNHTQQTAISARVRKKVEDLAVAMPGEYEAPKVAEAVNQGGKSVIEALRSNAAVDREEIDLLWWVLADWSDVLGRPYSSPINPTAQALAAGLEAGRMMRRVPADVHRRLVLRSVNGGQTLTLTELLVAVADDRDALASLYEGNNFVAACPNVFPLLTALNSGEAAYPEAEIGRTISDWASRALLESSAVFVTSHLPNVGI